MIPLAKCASISTCPPSIEVVVYCYVTHLSTCLCNSYTAEEKPGTNLVVQNYGRGGKSLQLLTASPIQFSGYLISWRFYHVSGSSACDSYAAVWREETDSDNMTLYRLVDKSETLLTSDSQPGVYNTSIEDRIVRVDQGDVVSVHVKLSSSCSYNRVSFGAGNDGDPIAQVHSGHGHPAPERLPVPGSRPYKTARRGVAIQPFVEGENCIQLWSVLYIP